MLAAGKRVPPMSTPTFRIFAGQKGTELAQSICQLLGASLGLCTVNEHPDTETHVEINETVRGIDIFLIQICSRPVNNTLVETLLLLDALRRASTGTISLVLPYFPYARQERMAHGRESLSARVVANALETAGASRVIYVDIHALAIQGFFNIPAESLTAVPILCEYFQGHDLTDFVVVSPDVGRASLANRYAAELGTDLAVMHKKRSGTGSVETTHIVGNIEGKNPIVIDDIMAGGSVIGQLDALFAAGANTPAYFMIPHPIMLDSAWANLQSDGRFAQLVTTDTVPCRVPAEAADLVSVISIALLLADVIQRVHLQTSIAERIDYQ